MLLGTSRKAGLGFYDSVDLALDKIEKKWSKEGIFIPNYRTKYGPSILVAPEDYVHPENGREFFSWYDMALSSREMPLPSGWRLPSVLDVENIYAFYQGYSLSFVFQNELKLRTSPGVIPGAEMISYNSDSKSFHHEIEKSFLRREYVYWTSSVLGTNNAYCLSVKEGAERISFSIMSKWSGCRVRLVKDI